MARPKAYEPQEGYRYQILARNPSYGNAWEPCDYAEDRSTRNHLIREYRMAYGSGWEFESILLPSRYWPGRNPNAA